MREFDKNSSKKLFSRVGMAYFLMLVLTFVAQLVTFRVFQGWIKANPETYQNIQVMFSSLPMYLIAVPACIFCLTRIPSHRIQKTSWKPGKLFLILLIAFGLMYVANIFSVLLMLGVGILRGKPVTNDLMSIVEQSNPLFLAVYTVILAPVIEELLFRKLLIDRIYPYGEKICVLVSGILFGLMHGNFYQFFYAFILGAIFGYIYVKTGRLRYSIVFHMIINFQGSIVAIALTDYLQKSGIMENPMAIYDHLLGFMLVGGYMLLVIFAAITGIVLFFCSLRRISFQPGEIAIPKGHRFQTIFVNAGMILFALASVSIFAMSLV